MVEVKPTHPVLPSNKPAVIQTATGNIAVGDSVLFSLKGEEFRALVRDVHPSWIKVSHLNSKGKTEEKNVKTKFVTHRIVR